MRHPTLWALMGGYFTYLYCLWIFILGDRPIWSIPRVNQLKMVRMHICAWPRCVGRAFGAAEPTLADQNQRNGQFARRSVALMGILCCGGLIRLRLSLPNPYILRLLPTGAMFFSRPSSGVLAVGWTWREYSRPNKKTCPGMMNMGDKYGGARRHTVCGYVPAGHGSRVP